MLRTDGRDFASSVRFLIEVVDRVRIFQRQRPRCAPPRRPGRALHHGRPRALARAPRMLARRMAYCLAKAGAIVPVGRTVEGVRYASSAHARTAAVTP